MAHHQRHNYDRTIAPQRISSNNSVQGSTDPSFIGDEEVTSDVDEPPESQIRFAKLFTPASLSSNFQHGRVRSSYIQCDRKQSLLTQALLNSPEMSPMSDIEVPVLTSDGGLTSPARTTTPSPPLPSVSHQDLGLLVSKESTFSTIENSTNSEDITSVTNASGADESKVTQGLGRKRCITFACGREAGQKKIDQVSARTQYSSEQPIAAVYPLKRPCMLRFACPVKPCRPEPLKSPTNDEERPCSRLKENISQLAGTVKPRPTMNQNEHRKSNSSIGSSPPKITIVNPESSQSRRPATFNRVDFQKSEATRFHEFACPFDADDEWTNEQTAYKERITVNDTLRKENAIRRLAEEAEEEAFDEENLVQDDDVNELQDEGNEDEIYDLVSDGGNETDDEEGFAESDDDTDSNFDYKLWTPILTTAATSMEHLEHIRLQTRRAVSSSSLESDISIIQDTAEPRKPLRVAKSSKILPGASTLPDNNEFVIGTIDEDRPLEDAYMSCLEERRRSRHKLIPQDIDPSFPTSEPEAEGETENEDDLIQQGDDPDEVVGKPESSSGEYSAHLKDSVTKVAFEPSVPSPKRLHSSPPSKSARSYRSSPPRRLFGQSTHRLRSPPPLHRRLHSPPSSRQPSFDDSPFKQAHRVAMPRLGQRPNLTHTTSLPRTPNPFWSQHRKSRLHKLDTPSTGTSPKSSNRSRAEIHSRGPIDIVQGLETKRQRRKDKFWRQHCRTGLKEKERRCQPGEGAERMKELGLEMADRCKGFGGQRPQLVLSM